MASAKESGGFFKLNAPEGMSFMKGTGGAMDYLILGTFDSFKLAIKPLYHRGKDYHALGFRLRCVWDDPDVTILDLVPAVKMRFPKAPWSKRTAEYCSMVGAVPMEEVMDYQSAMLWLDNVNYVVATIQTIENLLEFDLGGEKRGIVQDFLNEAYKLLIEVVNSDSKTKEPVELQNKVVQFKPKGK